MPGEFGWIAVAGLVENQILDAVGLVVAPDATKPKASFFSLPSGWSILFTLRFDFPTPERMTALSAAGQAIAVSADERVMFSVVRGYERGKAVFAIEHDGGEQGARHIAVAGTAPAQWAAILEQANRKQDEEEVGDAVTDFVFDAPMALAEALCGYRHDTPWPEGAKPQVTLLVARQKPGLLGRLLRRG